MEFIAGSNDFSEGKKNRHIIINDKLSFIPVICYEIIFYWKLLNMNNHFSDFIVNITSRLRKYSYFVFASLLYFFKGINII